MNDWMRAYTLKMADLETKWMILQEKLNAKGENYQGRYPNQNLGQEERIDSSVEGVESGSEDGQGGAGNPSPQTG